MGGIWLYDLPDVLAAAGLTVEVWPGWENRARGSGGYDAVRAVFVHHTASNASPDADRTYMWENSPDGPVGAIYLARDGTVTVGAAGATNCQGKGGPWNLSTGTIPIDQGNAYGIAIEAANVGTGAEAWPAAQCDAYLAACSALSAAYGLDPARDVLAHFEWVEPSCPGRKIDPAGPSPWATGAASWAMDGFRADVGAGVVPPTPPEPEPEPIPPTDLEGDTDVSTFLLRNRDSGQIVLLAYDGAGITATGMSGDDLDTYVARFGPWLDTDPTVFDDFIRKSNG